MKTTENSAACNMPPPLSEDDLFAALDGESTPKIQAHLNHCAFCSMKLENMRMSERLLQQVMYRAECPSSDDLADYVMEILATSDKSSIDGHLERCMLCQKEIVNLNAIVLKDEPVMLTEKLQIPLWQQFKEAFQSFEEHLIQILLPQPVTTAGALKGSSEARVLRYHQDNISVMLSLEKVVYGIKVNASILDTETQERWRTGFAELVALPNEQVHYLARIDEDETFRFDSVEQGQFNLNIYAVKGQILRLQKIELKL